MSVAPDPAPIALSARIDAAEHNALFRQIVERTPDAVFVHLDGRLIYVNQAAVRMLGVASADALIDRSAYELVHPDDRPKSTARVERLHAGDVLPRAFQRLVRADGSVFLGEVESYLVPWVGTTAVAAFIRDVTQHHAMLETLRRTHAALNTGPDPVFITDADRMRHVEVNDAACRLLGYTADELLAIGPVEVSVGRDHASFEAMYADLEARGEGVPVDEQRLRRLRCKDGREVPVEIRRSFLHSGGRRLVMTSVRDVTERLASEGALARFRAALDIAADGIFLVDRATMRFVDVNETACRMLGYTRDELLRIGPVEINDAITRADLERMFDEALNAQPGAISVEGLRWVPRKDGTRIPMDVRRTARTIDGRVVIATICRDATERLLAEETLRLGKSALEAASNPILILDVRDTPDRIVYANPAFEKLTGHAADAIAGQSWSLLYGHDTEQPALPGLIAAIAARTAGKGEIRNYRRDGTLFWNDIEVSPVRDDTGTVTHCVLVGDDVTDEHLHQDELEHRATHDALTGLANRRLLDDRLAMALASAQRHQRVLAVVFIDLDHFKEVNDSLGHAAGDQLLRSVASRLLACVREGDTVSRQGGDEFVLLLTDQADRGSIELVLTRIRDAVSRPHEVDGRPLAIGCSLGASLYPAHGDDAADLIRAADRAMYAAKQAGRNTWRIAD
ncbi:MAG: PAS domain S-box protein [Burkholderiales bacterium]|jgi:diguanylate cyclase (GGDEF)-like protein/PAS domain S-box-containing protein|nr:PAS domain S-box protein [Burkholderiales bacterium]